MKRVKPPGLSAPERAHLLQSMAALARATGVLPAQAIHAACVANARNRDEAKRLAMPAWANREKIREVYAEAARRTAETGVVYVVDHIVPLRHKHVSGLHVHHNLQILTHAENERKGNTFKVGV